MNIKIEMIILFLGFFITIYPHQKAESKLNSVSDTTKFTIENCVNQFSFEDTIKTKAGYQYWFANKSFLNGRTIKMSVVKPHSATHSPHSHQEDEFFFVLEGTAEFYLNGETAIGTPYSSFYCPPNSIHGIKNIGDKELKYLVIKKYILDK